MAGDDQRSSERNNDSSTNQMENIKVAVRLRPFTEKEKQRNNRRIVDIEQKTVVLYNPKGDYNLKKFTFDYSYWSHDGYKRDTNGVNIPDPDHANHEKYVGQEEVFEDLGQFLLTNALKGYNSALLAYGQTGSGKSYTVSGYGRNEGILPRFARSLFEELDKKSKSTDGTKSMLESTTTRGMNQVLSLNESDEERAKIGVSNSIRYEVFFSMLEIYNEVVRDLLAKNHGDMVSQTTTFARRGLKIREHPKHGFFVENLTSYPCADKFEIERKIEEGQLNKSIAATSMNETSSRGHTIYEFRIKQYKQKIASRSEETLTTSVVQLVDLAGSERLAVHVTGQMGGDSFIGSRTNTPYPTMEKSRSVRNPNRSSGLNSASSATSTGQSSSSSSMKQRAIQSNQSMYGDHLKRFKESVSINQSLSALGNCIQVLSQYSQQLEMNGSTKKSPKIPYRDSALTKLLNRCCLSGNSKVVIIATLSPADTNYDDTLSTLRFADRAKQIRTHATINLTSRNDVVDNLQKENERLKQMVDGRVTRSDDSSQTSNFDDSENVMENFTGSKIQGKINGHETTATPIRSRTTVRKSRDAERHRSTKRVDKQELPRLTSSSSNPSLIVKEQMKRLVSPASRKVKKESLENNETLRKSRSMVHGLTGNGGFADNEGDDLDEIELNELTNSETTNEDDLGDIVEGIISPDSDDSFAPLTTDDMTNEEKIDLFNKLLSVSTINNYTQTTNKSPSKDQTSRPRPKKANQMRGSLRQVSVLSSSLKKSNPFLSNLNPDEQLSGMISYIIKEGINVVGKSSDSDIVLHGTELRSHHAQFTRVESDQTFNEESVEITDLRPGVYIEPLLDVDGGTNELEKNVALMVNGAPVTGKIRLNHCDRILFGTNAYFVFNDISSRKSASDTIADLDLVTFDMARNEVLREVMAEKKNEEMIKEIKDYTHRPGTGKHKVKAEELKEKEVRSHSTRISKTKSTKLTRSMTIHDRDIKSDSFETKQDAEKPPSPENNDFQENDSDNIQNISLENQEASYRDQLMDDTYEFAIPVAEVNAVAKEMGIKVTYGLKILTGEEQLPMSVSSTCTNSIKSEGSSATEDAKESAAHNSRSEDSVTHLYKVDGLDVPPAVYIKVHLEDHNMDFYWSKEKFQARRFKILELYGAWDVGGKPGLVEHLIDQSKAQGEYLIDPFVDDPNSTPVLIGHAQITLQPIAHLAEVDQSYDILDLNDEILGTISIQAIPCHGDFSKVDSSELYQPYTDDDLKKNLLESPTALLGKKLIFLLKIVSCTEIPVKFVNVYCQYILSSDRSLIRTEVLREENPESDRLDINSGDLIFNHSHYIYFEQVTQDIIDFLQHGFVTIQVVGHYRTSESVSKSPTVISTIINSINKYKFKIENQNLYSSMNYASGYSNSNSDSARSNQGPTSAIMNSNSGASSVASTSATVNLFDQQNDEDEGSNSINGLSQENIIDMILTKRKLDRAENQLHYLKRTVNIAEHYNKKHIPVRTVKKLLNSYGHELDSGSLEEMAADVTVKGRSTNNKNSACSIQ